MVIEERVSRARTEYREKLCGRVEELAGLLAAAPSDPGCLAAAQRLAHRIYGSAGTFGFAAVGEAARTIDQRLLRVLEGKESSSPSLFEELAAALQTARDSLCR